MLRSVADARYLSLFGFAPCCTELHRFAAKNFPTVEKTVNAKAVLARALRAQPSGGFTTYSAPAGSFGPNEKAINAAGAITGFYCDAVTCHGYLWNSVSHSFAYKTDPRIRRTTLPSLRP